MTNALKLGCLAIYAGALAAMLGSLSGNVAAAVQLIAAGLLAVHALELVVMFKHVRRYDGPLAVSVLLTILFGLLHWLPLARRHGLAQGSVHAKK